MKQFKITFLTGVGSALEYYDFVIYSLLASFISQQFFPSSDRVTSMFATFGVFALGYVVRPIGGIIFGLIGDRFGRKKVFASTLLWMALATFLMGLTPTFSTWGLTATIIFSACRITQGLVFGAEMPGALTLLSEHIDNKRHGLHFGFMIAMVSLGVLLGSGVTWILTEILTEKEFLAWGFRIPFLLGGCLAIAGFIIRKHLPETPVF
jgi:MFS family permease